MSKAIRREAVRPIEWLKTSSDAPRFPPPWSAEPIRGGYVVKDATGQSIAYVSAREPKDWFGLSACLTATILISPDDPSLL